MTTIKTASAVSAAQGDLEHAKAEHAKAVAWAETMKYPPGSLAWIRAMREAIQTDGGCIRCDSALPVLEEDYDWDEPSEEILGDTPPAYLANELVSIQDNLLSIAGRLKDDQYCTYCQHMWEKTLAE